MPRVLDKNVDEIYEICFHHLPKCYKTPNCKTCSPDYNPENHPNNYDCPSYNPRLQIDSDKLIKKLTLEIKRDLTSKQKEIIYFYTNAMNTGLIGCDGHKVDIAQMIKTLREFLNVNTLLS